jgi:transaldolase
MIYACLHVAVRNTGEITELAGCDRLTISPALLQQLHDMKVDVPAKLSPARAAEACTEPQVHFDEAGFRWALNEVRRIVSLCAWP